MFMKSPELAVENFYLPFQSLHLTLTRVVL